LFSEFWPIAVTAVLGTSGILALRLGSLRQGAGAILGDRSGCKVGVVSFSLGIVVLSAFYFADRSYLQYAIPLLLLTLADASAALIGLKWGRNYYTVLGGVKSVEGTLSFFIVALICSGSMLLATSEFPIWRAMFVAVVLSLAIATLEAICAHGIDNFAVPVAAYLLLEALELVELPGLLISLLFVTCLACLLIRFCLVGSNQVRSATRLSSATSDTT
jgi:phytol kinase